MAFETDAAVLLLQVPRDGVAPGRVLMLGHQHLHFDPATHPRLLARPRRDAVHDAFATAPQQNDYVSGRAGDKRADLRI